MVRVLVTGGASGIGAAVAAAVERDGGSVVRVDVGEAPGIHALDVTDEAGWESLSEEVGPLDGLVCSAGVRTRSMIVDTTLADWERHLRVNVTGTWLAIRTFLRAIPEGDTSPR